MYDTNNAATVKFGVAPDTWPVRSAIRRVRNSWLEMHKDIFTKNPQLKPNWHDFKMMLSDNQVDDSSNSSRYYPTFRVPEDIHDNNIEHNDGGITWSLFTTQDGTQFSASADKDEFFCHLLGGHIQSSSAGYISVGALTSWVGSRPGPVDMFTPSMGESDNIEQDPINNLFNDGDANDEIIDNFQQVDPTSSTVEGDQMPPYHIDNPNWGIMEVAAAKCSSAQPVSYFTGFNALLGQVFLKIKSDGNGTIDFIFDINPKGASI